MLASFSVCFLFTRVAVFNLDRIDFVVSDFPSIWLRLSRRMITCALIKWLSLSLAAVGLNYAACGEEKEEEQVV